MNTEDKFYFGKHGQPERFGLMRVELLDAGRSSMVSTDEFKRYAIANIPGVSRSDFLETMIEKVNAWAKQNGKGVRAKVAVKGMDFSRPGQPERFEAAAWMPSIRAFLADMTSQRQKVRVWISGRDTVNVSGAWQQVWKSGKGAAIAGRLVLRLREAAKMAGYAVSGSSEDRKDDPKRGITTTVYTVTNMPPDAVAYLKNWGISTTPQSFSGFTGTSAVAYSRPGQPERFDASSLDRKGFAAASSSPMLGKLLSEKQMPEGGWRAVETGGGALVISFEDGDVAGNFARRVASHGYSATAPVQSIGRYWNVEVKNGK
jgi:hypothetical protein